MKNATKRVGPQSKTYAKRMHVRRQNDNRVKEQAAKGQKARKRHIDLVAALLKGCLENSPSGGLSVGLVPNLRNDAPANNCAEEANRQATEIEVSWTSEKRNALSVRDLQLD